MTVTSVTMNLVYNSSLLTVTAATVASGLPTSYSVTLTTSTPGVATISFTAPAGLALSAGVGQNIVTLTATVPNTAGCYGEKEILDLQSIQISGGSGSIPAVDDGGIHAVGYVGDVAGVMTYDVTDSLAISRYAANLTTGFQQWPLADPAIIGAVSGNGKPTATDAMDLARAVLGMSPGTFIPALPTNVTPTIAGPDPVMNVEAAFTATAGTVLAVPVNLSYSAGLESVDLALSYDTSRLEVTAADVERGSLTAGFDSFVVNVDQAQGLIYISGYRSAGPVTGLGAGSLAVINFQVKADAPAGAAAINLLQNAGNTWSLPAGVTAQGTMFLFDLEPGQATLPATCWTARSSWSVERGAWSVERVE